MSNYEHTKNAEFTTILQENIKLLDKYIIDKFSMIF